MIIGREIGADHGEIWLATRQRVRGLLAGRTPADMSTPVPAMPGLTVRDVLSALVATAADALDGDIHATYTAPDGGRAPAAGTDAELLAAWDAQAAGIAALVRDDPRAGRLLIDLVTHEHDLRGALDCPGARDDDAVAIAVELLAEEFAARLRAAGAPAQVVLVRGQVDEEPPGPRIIAHEHGDTSGLRVPGREQFGARPGVRRATAAGGPVRRVDVAVERVGPGGEEPAQHVAHGQARHGRHRPGHVGRRAPGEQPADTLPGSEPDLPVVAADLSADNHATNLAIGWPAGQLRPGTLLVSLFYYTEVI